MGASRLRGEGKSPSTNFSTSVVVTTTLVKEAMSYIVSIFVSGRSRRRSSDFPKE